MKVSISFIMYTEKSTIAYSKNRVIVAAHREKHKKKECRAINWDLDSNLFSPHKKEKYAAGGSRFSHTQSAQFPCKEERLPLFHVHLLQCKNAPLLSSAAGVHGGVRNVRPHLPLFITSPEGYTRSTIVITNSYTRKDPAPPQLAGVALLTDVQQQLLL